MLESFVGIQFRDYESTLYSFDAKVFGDVFSLPAGKVQLAIGADTRDETLDYKNDKMDQTGGWLQATPTQPFSADLSSQGYFAEVRVPVFSPDFNVPGFYALELSLAGRQEVLRHDGRPVRAEVHHALAAVRRDLRGPRRLLRVVHCADPVRTVRADQLGLHVQPEHPALQHRRQPAWWSVARR